LKTRFGQKSSRGGSSNNNNSNFTSKANHHIFIVEQSYGLHGAGVVATACIVGYLDSFDPNVWYWGDVRSYGEPSDRRDLLRVRGDVAAGACCCGHDGLESIYCLPCGGSG
jgi:hypothetical protein